LAIGNGSKEVFYNAAHHANEWITTPLLLKFLEDYSEAYAADGMIGNIKASYLYHKVRLYIVPMVNPDGTDLVNGGISPESPVYDRARMIAHNYPAVPFPNGWKANIAGVDLNLQYPAGWERAREQKFENGFTRPGPRDFVGIAPLSEPESAAVFSFTRLHNFSLTVSYHTQGEVIYWRYLNYLPANSLETAKRFGIASGYPYVETPEYSGYAGYKDWFIQKYNRPGYTVEAGTGESPLPLSQFSEIYAKNLGILTLGMDLA
jgi:g-D-glutamyl-meso-diaminopimelate peptidase